MHCWQTVVSSRVATTAPWLSSPALGGVTAHVLCGRLANHALGSACSTVKLIVKDMGAKGVLIHSRAGRQLFRQLMYDHAVSKIAAAMCTTIAVMAANSI